MDGGIVGCGLHGAWAARCLAAAGARAGVCADPRPEAADALAAELGWEAGTRAAALAGDVVCCVTPGHEPVVGVEDLRPGLHLNMLGADGPGKAEATVEAVAALLPLLRRVGAGVARRRAHARGGGRAVVGRDASRASARCWPGAAPGRTDRAAVTLFDSTGLAIQDLAIAVACHAALESDANPDVRL